MEKRANNKNKKINKKQKGQGRVILEFNLSKAIFICIIIGVLIAVSTIRVITTNAERKTALAGEETENSETVTWVESTSVNESGETVVDVDEEGNPIKVPIPKGYTASKVPGETSANTGLVIYEGDVDWSTILVDDVAETNTNSILTSNEDEGSQNIDSQNETELANLTITNNETTTNVTNEILSNNIEESEEKTDEKETKEAKAQTNTEENEESQVSTLADETTGEITQTDINVFNLQKERNQYVWVPVKDLSRIYGVDSNGKLWGKLYNFSSSGKSANNWRESTSGVMSISSKKGYREPDVTHYIANYDVDSGLQSYMDGKTEHELLSNELEILFAETIESIQKYGGFYIGRYETGGLNTTAVVRKMDTNISNQNWYTMYDKCKKLKGNNTNVITSMIWGSLWDETLDWLVESKATISNGSELTYSLVGSDSTTWGNYRNATLNYIPTSGTTPEETSTKDTSSSTRIPSGSSSYTKANNIYDLAGNVYDWTLEAYSTDRRVCRGGVYNYYGGSSPADYRNGIIYPTYNTYDIRLSFPTFD